ncbi:MAG: Methionyl-tRNA formyltransferase [Verrucomicrobiaceae bacterium]|nr:Methionyl-tRNA formyltransferase [Verrucomicrobiaceae bacterium]
MRIVFIGAVEFSQRALQRLLTMQANVVGVCTLQQSEFHSDHVDLAADCNAHGIPYFYAENINASEAVNWIRDKMPDVIFCFGWSQLLQQEILTLAPHGVVGFHPAALPSNRGRHPLIWALVLGLESTASTFFFMDGGADRGDILSQREIIINDEDNARVLYDKVTRIALEQIEEFLPLLASGSFQRKKQDHRLANTWRRRGRKDGEIDWRMAAQSIHNLVRGLTKPYVGAHFTAADGTEIKVWKTAMVNDAPKNAEPGKILMQKKEGPVVKCGDAAICLLETEPLFKPEVGSYL